MREKEGTIAKVEAKIEGGISFGARFMFKLDVFIYIMSAMQM